MKKSKHVKQGLIWIAPKKLKPHPLNTTLFGDNDTNFEELKQSILGNGFLVNHPILCCQKDKSLMIISGHRRWRAAIEIGIDQVPITIIPITDDSEIERMIIEENLLRPQEGRKFSHLERYVLALRLSSKFPEQRGGDRRSADFVATRGSKSIHKDHWLAEKIGLCAKYISELNVIAKKICEETSKAYPELLSGIPLHEQLQIILSQNLSADLSNLQAGSTIGAIYKKYRAAKPKPAPNPQVSPHISCSQVNHLDPLYNASLQINFPDPKDLNIAFLRGFKDFLLEHFSENENLHKAIQLLSSAPKDHTAALKVAHKGISLILKSAKQPINLFPVGETLQLFSQEGS